MSSAGFDEIEKLNRTYSLYAKLKAEEREGSDISTIR